MRAHRNPFIGFLVAFVLAMTGLAFGAPRADAIPDADRDVKVFRYDKQEMPLRWSYAVDPDRQVGEKIVRVYIFGRLADRIGSLWVRKDVAQREPLFGNDVHVRIVTRDKDGSGGDNWHYWVRSKRVNIL